MGTILFLVPSCFLPSHFESRRGAKPIRKLINIKLKYVSSRDLRFNYVYSCSRCLKTSWFSLPANNKVSLEKLILKFRAWADRGWNVEFHYYFMLYICDNHWAFMIPKLPGVPEVKFIIMKQSLRNIERVVKAFFSECYYLLELVQP